VVEKEQVNAIITDIRMPRMDGVELIRRLKARGSYMQTAVALSGFSDLPPRETYDLGIEAQLSKPVSRKVLVAAVETALTDRAQLWAGPPGTWETNPHPGSVRQLENCTRQSRNRIWARRILHALRSDGPR